MRNILLSAIGLLISAYYGFAQDKPSKFWQRFNLDSFTTRPLHVVPLPIVRIAPETGFAVGVSLDYLFNTDSATTRESYTWIQAMYSTRKQLIIEPAWQIYTPQEKYFIRGQAGYADFSEHFWGIGNDINPAHYSTLLYQRVHLQAKPLRKLNNSKTFVGINFSYSYTSPIEVFEGVWEKYYEGANGSSVIGIGPNVTFDYRDNPYSPLTGWFLEATTLHYQPSFGSKYTYNEYLVDFRKYQSFANKHFWGWQVVGQFMNGDVPLRELNRLGNANIMRGYIAGMYRDKQLLMAQTEYRIPIGRFFVGAAFASVGKVSDTATNLINTSQWRLGYGIGIRMLVNKQRNIYSRLDFALNDQFKPSFYFRIFDAF